MQLLLCLVGWRLFLLLLLLTNTLILVHLLILTLIIIILLVDFFPLFIFVLSFVLFCFVLAFILCLSRAFSCILLSISDTLANHLSTFLCIRCHSFR